MLQLWPMVTSVFWGSNIEAILKLASCDIMGHTRTQVESRISGRELRQRQRDQQLYHNQPLPRRDGRVS